jgi:hypothetical protein
MFEAVNLPSHGVFGVFCLFRAALLSASPAVYWLGMVSKREGMIWGEGFVLLPRLSFFDKSYSSIRFRVHDGGECCGCTCPSDFLGYT